MITERCPRCNRIMYLQTCDFCEQQNRELLENTARAAEANERAAWAAQNLAATQQQMLQEQREEQERRQQQEWMAAFAALPQVIEQELPSARTSSSKALLLLAKVEKVARDLQPASWISLHQRAPVETEVIYGQLRKSVVPLVRALWQARDRIPSSSAPLLCTIARSVLFKDFSGLQEFHEKKVQLDQQFSQSASALTSERDGIQRYGEEQVTRISHLQQQLWLTRARGKVVWIALACFIAAAFGLLVFAAIDDSLAVVSGFCFMTPFIFVPMGLFYRFTAKQFSAQLSQGQAALENAEKLAPIRLAQIEEQLRQSGQDYQVRLQQLADGKRDPTLIDLAGLVGGP